MGDFLLQAYKNAPAFTYFDLLPPEIQLMVFDYVEYRVISYRIRLSTVSKQWRELIVRATRYSVLRLGEVNALPEEGYAKKRINPRWIGGKFSVATLELDSARFTVNQAHELIDTMSSLTTVIDPRNMLFMRPTTPRILSHIKYYCCQEVKGGITNMVNALPNLEALSINLLSAFPTTNLKLTKLHTIYISERRPFAQHLPTLIPRLKAIAPYLRTLFVTPHDQGEGIAYDRKNSMGLHLIVDLFGPVLKQPKIFAEQFEANKRPYNFYRSGHCTLFRRAVEHKYFDTAKYMLENGLTTVKDEMGSYKLFPSTLDKCFNIKSTYSSQYHPFIIDSSFTDESFMAYLISNGLNFNAMVDGKTFFKIYYHWSYPLVQYVLTKADIDFNVRTLQGQNPFHLLAKDDALETFKLAIKRIENKPELVHVLYQCDHKGNTPLHMIFNENRNCDMIDCVLKLNIDLTVKNSDELRNIDMSTATWRTVV